MALCHAVDRRFVRMGVHLLGIATPFGANYVCGTPDCSCLGRERRVQHFPLWIRMDHWPASAHTLSRAAIDCGQCFFCQSGDPFGQVLCSRSGALRDVDIYGGTTTSSVHRFRIDAAGNRIGKLLFCTGIEVSSTETIQFPATLIQERMMTVSLAGLSLLLLMAGNEKFNEIEIKDAQLTLIEHADISARDAGVLNQIYVKEGETVELNAPIALIDDQDARLMQQRAETEFTIASSLAQNDLRVRFARKSLDVAKAELKRSMESVEKFPKSVSQTELDRLKLLADKADLDVDQAEFEMAQAKLTEKLKKHDFDKSTLQLERRTIKAPFPGMIVQLKRRRGEWVDAATPVARLIRLNRLRAEGFVSSSIAPAKLVGRTATFRVDGTRHKGTLTFIHPEIDPVNQQVRVWAEIENEDLSLRPGQIGTLTIHEEEAVIKGKP